MISRSKCRYYYYIVKMKGMSFLCYSFEGFKPGMLKLETCTETWVFEQSSCWKYCMQVGEIWKPNKVYFSKAKMKY